MHPLLATIELAGRVYLVGTYGVCLLVAIGAGIGLTLYHGRRFSYDSHDILIYAVIAVSGGIAGAWVTGAIFAIPYWIRDGFAGVPLSLVSWGGMLGGWIALLLMRRYWQVPLAEYADIGAPGMLLGMGIGRIGCFFAGCCYGIGSDSIIAVRFTDPLAPASAVAQPLVPVQLISAALLLLLALAVSLILRRKPRPGFTFLLSCVLYALHRFIVDFWRGDGQVASVGLTAGQLFSLLLLVASLAGIARLQARSFPRE